MRNIAKRIAAISTAAAVALGLVVVAPVTAKADTLGTAYIGFGETSGWSYNVYRGEGGENAYAGTDITGDGTYTCELKASDVGTFDYSAEPTLFYIDISGLGTSLGIEDITADESNYGITVSDVSVTCDGNSVTVTQDNVNLSGGSTADGEAIRINFINPWSDNYPDDSAVIATKIEFTDTLTVTFTISGLSSDSTDASDDTTDDTTDDSSDASDDTTDDTTDDSSTTDEKTTQAGDVAPIAAVAVALAGCAAIVFASKKRMA